jgi:hypothetical protein
MFFRESVVRTITDLGGGSDRVTLTTQTQGDANVTLISKSWLDSDMSPLLMNPEFVHGKELMKIKARLRMITHN